MKYGGLKHLLNSINLNTIFSIQLPSVLNTSMKYIYHKKIETKRERNNKKKS